MAKDSFTSSLLSFLSSVQGDLANITAPPQFLAPSSVVELGPWGKRPALFAAPANEPDPKRRALLVLKIVLAALRDQLYTTGSTSVSIKKPLNAFLGEVFMASWTDEDTGTKAQLFSEQVSHHPPITAMHIACDEHGIRAGGYARVEMTFGNAINIRQIGHAILHIDKFDEDYLIPLPDVQVRGYLAGCLYPEILGTYTIESSNGYVSEMEFFGSGFFSAGKKNRFKARVFSKEDPDTTLYDAEGVWSDSWTVRDGLTGDILEKFSFDNPKNEASHIEIPAIEAQDPWESRRAWAPVIDRLVKSDYHAASQAKHKLEQAQRQMRAQEAKDQQSWTPLLFRNFSGDDHGVFHRLAEGTDWKLRDKDTKGVWKFDVSRIDGLRRPFRGDMTPYGTS